ncbi:hypothetical protein V8G54_035173 [Vigna mungo]|uniref:Uncharacterized protein n=1 Tax=Vigna mungo TaxID=3915 RepID=A0AAQ3MET3_VIGMU
MVVHELQHLAPRTLGQDHYEGSQIGEIGQGREYVFQCEMKMSEAIPDFCPNENVSGELRELTQADTDNQRPRPSEKMTLRTFFEWLAERQRHKMGGGNNVQRELGEFEYWGKNNFREMRRGKNPTLLYTNHLPNAAGNIPPVINEFPIVLSKISLLKHLINVGNPSQLYFV